MGIQVEDQVVRPTEVVVWIPQGTTTPPNGVTSEVSITLMVPTETSIRSPDF